MFIEGMHSVLNRILFPLAVSAHQIFLNLHIFIHACVLRVTSRHFANKIIQSYYIQCKYDVVIFAYFHSWSLNKITQYYHISEMFDVVIDNKAKTLYVCLKVRQYCLCALWPG